MDFQNAVIIFEKRPNSLESLPMGQFYFEERRPIVTIFAQQPALWTNSLVMYHLFWI